MGETVEHVFMPLYQLSHQQQSQDSQLHGQTQPQQSQHGSSVLIELQLLSQFSSWWFVVFMIVSPFIYNYFSPNNFSVITTTNLATHLRATEGDHLA
tara:strand:+ start:198 stop:488 length:291 start_codon:yes stop_codon:yes gene_type:complete